MERMNNCKLFIGKISHDIDEEDISSEFGRFGKILKLDFKKSYDKDKPSFAFLTYEDPQNAQEAIDALNGRDFMGSILAVSQATANREKLEKNRIPRKNRFVANNLAPETSWQDLKDWGREGGSVVYTNVFTRNGQKSGIIEFDDNEDVDKALRVLSRVPLHGVTVKLEKDGLQTHNQDYRPSDHDFRYPTFRDDYDRLPYKRVDSRHGSSAHDYDREYSRPPARHEYLDRYHVAENRRTIDDRDYRDRSRSRERAGPVVASRRDGYRDEHMSQPSYDRRNRNDSRVREPVDHYPGPVSSVREPRYDDQYYSTRWDSKPSNKYPSYSRHDDRGGNNSGSYQVERDRR